MSIIFMATVDGVILHNIIVYNSWPISLEIKMDSVLCKLEDPQKRLDILEQPKYNQGKMYTNCHLYMQSKTSLIRFTIREVKSGQNLINIILTLIA